MQHVVESVAIYFLPTPALIFAQRMLSFVVQLRVMAKLGFLGLGIMGYPMARNLLRAGHEVALWTNTEAKAKELAETEKGKFCATPKDVGTFADVIFLIVGDTKMAPEAILGAHGLAQSAKP